MQNKMKMVATGLIIVLFVVSATLIFYYSVILLQTKPNVLDPPKEPDLQLSLADVPAADKVHLAEQRIAAYKAYFDAVKAVAEANGKQPITLYTTVIKDVLLGILTALLAAFATYAFSVAATDVGHNVALSKGAPISDLKKFTLFG